LELILGLLKTLKILAQDKPPEGLDTMLEGLPPRWKNWVIRGIFTWLMIGGFGLIIYGGPLALMLTTFLVQVKVRGGDCIILARSRREFSAP
jgi:hypothetical protein